MVALQSVEDCCAHFVLPLQVSARVKQTNKQTKIENFNFHSYYTVKFGSLCSFPLSVFSVDLTYDNYFLCSAHLMPNVFMNH